ncbi:hypothetical protein [Streptomyces sp. TP-A0356]
MREPLLGQDVPGRPQHGGTQARGAPAGAHGARLGRPGRRGIGL